ncbi:dihydropteroate synthase [Paracoccus suum]|uniref:Dihydropteroate synthase n=1 Tax=Paracoccus suum TaxID=2259340 RepID=A0A344PM59_9RHOB|nr:dihydropteroate synthase [Paracoccus suum]AXC50464.1 dihydropteroate synthase [Paracoccus suum]
MDERQFYRPIVADEGPPLAGGPLRFAAFEVLSRSRSPHRIAAEAAPPEVLAAFTGRRSFAGLDLGAPQVMGIINVTPDSFSDGGQWFDPDTAVRHGRELVAAGAAILDIGGESTRPGATQVPAAVEAARIGPVLGALAGLAPLSVDTRKAPVARMALDAGAGIINDVSALSFDPAMAGVIAASTADLVLMHAQGTPETMQDDPHYDDVLLDVYEVLEARVAAAEAAGIPRARIAVDPGIGFGKSQDHNIALLRGIALFHGLGCALMLGVSRKKFVGTIGGGAPGAGRDPGTLALTLAALGQGVQIHRVHNVADAVQGIRLWSAVAR